MVFLSYSIFLFSLCYGNQKGFLYEAISFVKTVLDEFITPVLEYSDISKYQDELDKLTNFLYTLYVDMDMGETPLFAKINQKIKRERGDNYLFHPSDADIFIKLLEELKKEKVNKRIKADKKIDDEKMVYGVLKDVMIVNYKDNKEELLEKYKKELAKYNVTIPLLSGWFIKFDYRIRKYIRVKYRTQTQIVRDVEDCFDDIIPNVVYVSDVNEKELVERLADEISFVYGGEL